jgi:hypothetical protein
MRQKLPRGFAPSLNARGYQIADRNAIALSVPRIATASRQHSERRHISDMAERKTKVYYGT